MIAFPKAFFNYMNQNWLYSLKLTLIKVRDI